MFGFAWLNVFKPIVNKGGDLPTLGFNSEKIQTNYPIFAFLYSKHIKTPWREVDGIDHDDVVNKLRDHVLPLLGQFVEITKNTPFLRVSAVFFEYLFFNNFLWVWYDPEEEKFYLLQKLESKEEEQVKYLDIIDNNVLEIPPSAPAPIKVMWDGYIKNRYKQWFEFSFKEISLSKLYTISALLWGKVGKFLDHTAKTDADLEKSYVKMMTLSPFIGVRGNEVVESLRLVAAEELKQYLYALYVWKDREMMEMGRVANINHKEEKKVVGEITTDVHTIKCINSLQQDQLNLFSEQLLEDFGIELTFVLVSALGAPSTNEEKPVEEKEEKDGIDSESEGMPK